MLNEEKGLGANQAEDDREPAFSEVKRPSKGTYARRRRWAPEAALGYRHLTRNEFELLRERSEKMSGIRCRENFLPIDDRWG